MFCVNSAAVDFRLAEQFGRDSPGRSERVAHVSRGRLPETGY